MEGKNAELAELLIDMLNMTLQTMLRVAEVSGMSGDECDALFRKTMDEFNKRNPTMLKGF